MSFAHQPLDVQALRDGQPDVGGLVFTPDPRPTPSFGFSAERWWARLPLPAARPPQLTYVRIDAPSSDVLEAYERCAGVPWQPLPRIAARHAVFEAHPDDAGCEVLIREESRAPVRFGVRLLRGAELPQTDYETLIGLTLGIALAVSGMAAFLWRATRRPEFLHFVAYQLATAAVILRAWGFVPGVMLAAHPMIGGLMGVAGLNLWVLEFFNYVQTSLRVPETRPRAARWFRLLTASACLAVIGEAMGQRFQWPLTVVNMAAGIVFWVSVIALQWSTQRRRALQQLLGYTPVLACFVIYLLSISGHAGLADLRLLFLLGQIGTTLALGWWMAQEFKRDRDRREDALALNVSELQANRLELERYQEDLETIVADRTTELQQALNSERAIVAQQRDFAAMIGHEFRTPLAVIDGQARRIARTQTAEDTLTRRSREIRDAVRDMIGLMDGLMAHARHSDGAAVYRFQTVPVREVIGAALRAAVPAERSADVRIRCPDGVLCWADPCLLSTAVGNVLANAAKYAAAGTPVVVEAHEAGGVIEIAVTDRGVGISPDEQGAVFAKFQRGSNVLTTTGSGLGLFLTRQIVEGHGGSIAVTSILGQGSRFTLRLPALARPEGLSDATVEGSV